MGNFLLMMVFVAAAAWATVTLIETGVAAGVESACSGEQ